MLAGGWNDLICAVVGGRLLRLPIQIVRLVTAELDRDCVGRTWTPFGYVALETLVCIHGVVYVFA